MSKLKEIWKKLDLKAALRVGSFAVAILMVVITSIFSLGLDPSQMNWGSWLSRTAILLFFSIYGSVFGESLGKDRSKKRVDGAYQNALKSYLTIRGQIIERKLVNMLERWLGWDWSRHEDEHKIDYLRRWGIRDPERVLSCLDMFNDDSFRDKILKHPVSIGVIDGKERFLKRQSQDQLDAVLDILEGRITLPVPHSAYYLDALQDTGSSLDSYEMPNHITLVENVTKWTSRISKILTSIIVSMFLGMLVVQSVMGADDAQEWIDLCSRLATLIINTLSGYMIGVVIVQQETSRINDKEMRLHSFLNSIDSGEYRPEDENDVDADEYRKWAETHRDEEAEELGIPLLVYKDGGQASGE